MKQRGNRLKQIQVDPKRIVANRERLAEIVADLKENGGVFTPRSNWVTLDRRVRPDEDGRKWLDHGFSHGEVETRMSTMEKMLEPWVGDTQMAPATHGGIDRFAPWLKEYDPLGLWAANVEDALIVQSLSVADLGSILDLNLLWSCIDQPDAPTTVLEIGGGYGRLAEAALNVFEDVKYVLVDAVPGSLLYANEYLRAACPQARIGFFYDGDAFDLNAFDCYIVPSWRFEKLNTATYEVCVNIESFQEMGQDQVDIFLKLFDRLSRPRALMYISNHHDAVRKSETQVLPRLNWNYPPTWRRLLCSNTPRSGTADHPTEAFMKHDEDWSRLNRTLLACHLWQAAQRRKPVAPRVKATPVEYLTMREDLSRLGKRLVRSALRRLAPSRRT